MADLRRGYKATRPDGTDFRTGTIDYAGALASGEVITHPAKFVRNDPATYLSVSTVPSDCTGMSWPCRLFVVEPLGRAYRNDDLPNKRCCRALYVIEERPAHEALGPQGEEVAALIERCRTLTMQETLDLGAAWGAARDAARDAARGAARGAAWGAVLALLTRGLIAPEQFDLLYGPWRKVIENG